MNLSNTSRYALRVITYMAATGNNLYSASSLSQKLNISDRYLKRILTSLTTAGILSSVQGRYGGFGMLKNHNNINLYEVISAVESIEKYQGCVLGFESCSDDSPCTLHIKWIPARNEIISFLETTTIDDIIKSPNIIRY